MRKLTLSLLAGAVVATAGGAALAQQAAERDSELTRSAVEQRTAQAFERMDANDDGKLDQTDREARRKAHFDRVDADSNGAISFAEFTALHTARGPAAEGGDGHRMHRRGGERMGFGPMRGAGRGRMADADNDGTVTQAEFQSAALQRFDRLDADKDGTVTRDEARAARETMRQQRRERRGQAS